MADTFSTLSHESVKWATHPAPGGLYASSADGGEICLRVGYRRHEDKRFSSITITKVIVPIECRRCRFYSEFLAMLDNTKEYGIRWHENVVNPILIERHQRYAYIKVDDSFYTVTGSPCSEKPQVSLENERNEFRKNCLSNEPRFFSMASKKRN